MKMPDGKSLRESLLEPGLIEGFQVFLVIRSLSASFSAGDWEIPCWNLDPIIDYLFEEEITAINYIPLSSEWEENKPTGLLRSQVTIHLDLDIRKYMRLLPIRHNNILVGPSLCVEVNMEDQSSTEGTSFSDG